ncbi:UNVERIFIED_ORG: hypothetical protein ABIB13_002207 [Arthrobacter sp. UYEF2]
MSAVPPELQRLFKQWDAAGRPMQRSFPWKSSGWTRWLPEHASSLKLLPNPIGRSAVTELFADVSDEASAVRAFLAASVWGFGDAGYGPYRTRAILDNNLNFAADLLFLNKMAKTQGGLAAFEHAALERRWNRGYFKGYGPAFATKFIYFTTAATPQIETSPVMDKVVASWCRKHVRGLQLRLDWHSAASYREYLAHVTEWANELDIRIDDVEQLIFTPGRN